MRPHIQVTRLPFLCSPPDDLGHRNGPQVGTLIPNILFFTGIDSESLITIHTTQITSTSTIRPNSGLPIATLCLAKFSKAHRPGISKKKFIPFWPRARGLGLVNSCSQTPPHRLTGHISSSSVAGACVHCDAVGCHEKLLQR